MKIVILDAATLGADVDLTPLTALGEARIYPYTEPEAVPRRIQDADVVVTNKMKLLRDNLSQAEDLKLICVTATGFDCIDVSYCRERGIGVCNVPGYSTDSVAQLTVAMALSLACHLGEYREFVHSGAYSAGVVANRLEPAWQELAGKTWGIVGGGNIGQRVARVAEALGCRVLMHRRKDDPVYENADLDKICRESDVISIHVPLNGETRGMIGSREIGLMKKSVILINVARGAVTDEEALTRAIEEDKIGALGVDVYSQEPFGPTHPFSRILDRVNVCLTPHTAWGAVEARNRCIREVAENIEAFRRGKSRNRVE